MLSCYFISINFAAFITFGLFLGMTMLISGGENIYVKKGQRIKVTMDKIRDVVITDKFDDLPKLQEIEKAPPKLILTIDPQSSVKGNVNLTPPSILTKVSDTPGGLNTLDGNFLPIVKPAPQYPIKMLEKGIEGYVTLKFTVTKEGSTRDVIVAHSSNRAFNKNAVKAGEKFKFKPRIVDGEAIDVTNVYNKIEFKLQK